MKFGRGLNYKILLYMDQNIRFLICLAKTLYCLSNFNALLMLFQANTATRLFYRVLNFAKPYDFISIPTIHCCHNE